MVQAQRTINTQQRSHAALWLAATVLASGLAAAVLWRFPPEVYGFYPKCPIFEYLHLQCPGCGATRAIAALLHGRLREAMRLNCLAVATLAAGIPYAAVVAARTMRDKQVRWPVIPKAIVFASLAVAAIFAVLRNLQA